MSKIVEQASLLQKTHVERLFLLTTYQKFHKSQSVNYRGLSALGATTNICEKYVKNEGEEIEKIEEVKKLETLDDKEINDFSMVLEREVKTECIALAESNTGMLSGKKTQFKPIGSAVT